ncbi:MAG TPA: mechanosensitive ion channel family protein [Propionibacteriaceae bacterium]|nr:mechanosensitive ion channel family protein [Propionibacteriaceae bacterium]
MSLLVTWVWPETPITIAVLVLVGVVGHALISMAVSRATALALHRSAQHAAGSTSAASRLIGHATGLANARAEQRTRTLGSLLRSISGVVITVIVVLTALSILGIPLAPLLASAGVGGIALAFGAQSLVKDYLTGIFMIVEDQFGVGDFITIGDISGTVQEVTLRVTRIQDGSGMIWYVRNGEVLKVGNLSQGYSTGTVDIPVAYDSDPETVLSVLREVAAAVGEEPEFADALVEPPTVLGVNAITGGSMTFQVLVKAQPNQQYGVLRAFRERALVALTAAGVKGPAIELPKPPLV